MILIQLYILLSSFFFETATNSILPQLYDDFVHYFRFASSAYAPFCLRPNGQVAVKRFHDILTDARGYVARDDIRQDIIVSFSGSATLVDTITDINLPLRPFNTPGIEPPNGTLVHTGFLTAWNAVASIVCTAVESQVRKYPGYKLVITGHSMGGAVASLAAISLVSKFPLVEIYLYTYGQPRTGNDVYAYWVNGKLGNHAFRVVHTTDWVPNAIPSVIFSFTEEQNQGLLSASDATASLERRYRHHGIEYWQNPDPPSAITTMQCAIDGEDPKCSNSVYGTSLVAHAMYFGILATWPFCV